MVTSRASIFIGAPPGPLREALCALLSSLAQAGSVQAASDPDDLLRLLAESAGEPGGSALVVLIANGPAPEAEIAAIRTAAPGARIAVISDDLRREDLDIRRGEPGMPDMVLRQGLRPEALANRFEMLLNEGGGDMEAEA